MFNPASLFWGGPLNILSELIMFTFNFVFYSLCKNLVNKLLHLAISGGRHHERQHSSLPHLTIFISRNKSPIKMVVIGRDWPRIAFPEYESYFSQQHCMPHSLRCQFKSVKNLLFLKVTTGLPKMMALVNLLSIDYLPFNNALSLRKMATVHFSWLKNTWYEI